MNTELNDPKEMMRRFMFACFLLSAVATLWLSVSVVVEWSFIRFGALVLIAIASGTFYGVGYHFFAFSSISETFILRNVSPWLNPRLQDIYRETEKIIELMKHQDLKPMERQAMRNRLSEIVSSEPEIFKILQQDIRSVHPCIRVPDAGRS